MEKLKEKATIIFGFMMILYAFRINHYYMGGGDIITGISILVQVILLAMAFQVNKQVLPDIMAGAILTALFLTKIHGFISTISAGWSHSLSMVIFVLSIVASIILIAIWIYWIYINNSEKRTKIGAILCGVFTMILSLATAFVFHLLVREEKITAVIFDNSITMVVAGIVMSLIAILFTHSERVKIYFAWIIAIKISVTVDGFIFVRYLHWTFNNYPIFMKSIPPILFGMVGFLLILRNASWSTPLESEEPLLKEGKMANTLHKGKGFFSGHLEPHSEEENQPGTPPEDQEKTF